MVRSETRQGGFFIVLEKAQAFCPLIRLPSHTVIRPRPSEVESCVFAIRG